MFVAFTSLSMLQELEWLCHTATDPDYVPLHQLVHFLCPTIRTKFALNTRAAEMCHPSPHEDKRAMAYLLRERGLWQDRTRDDPTGGDTLKMLFRGAVEASMLPLHLIILTLLSQMVLCSAVRPQDEESGQWCRQMPHYLTPITQKELKFGGGLYQIFHPSTDTFSSWLPWISVLHLYIDPLSTALYHDAMWDGFIRH